jgi:NAD(P)-dependent dehydrogenase (short-subunit alcohol dehydrogenase family)
MARVWLITGSSRGLGWALAEAVLARGDRLIATARNPESLRTLEERYGDQVRTVALDVQRVDQAQAAVQAALDAFGRLDVLVNNAAYGSLAAIEQSTEAAFRDQIETNLWGVINVTRAALPVLRRQRSGHIIQISSVGGRVPFSGLGPYLTAKWGVEGFSEVLAQEIAPFGVKLSIIEPGGMPTDWFGPTMDFTPPLEDYQVSVGATRAAMDYSLAHMPFGSDPARVAQLVYTVVEMPEPPLRLLAGSDALQMALESDERRLAETKKWRELTVSTDYASS